MIILVLVLGSLLVASGCRGADVERRHVAGSEQMTEPDRLVRPDSRLLGRVGNAGVRLV